MRRALVLVLFLLLFGVGYSGESIDIQAIQAKLAAQEARLNDMEAKNEKPATAPEGVTSLRKNATVTIGGEVTASYDHVRGKVESRYRSQ